MDSKDSRGIGSRVDSRFMCPSCSKSITNATKLMHLRTCGHILCSTCVNGLVVKDGACTVCSTMTPMSEIVKMESGGSGFSGSAISVMTKVETPAFQGC